MKAIVNGRSYDTDTAAHVVDLPCRHYTSDFAYHDTALYRSPKGQFFIAGRGNAASMWSRSYDGNSRGPGSGLRLVDEAEARGIMEDAGCEAGDFARVGLDVREG